MREIEQSAAPLVHVLYPLPLPIQRLGGVGKHKQLMPAVDVLDHAPGAVDLLVHLRVIVVRAPTPILTVLRVREQKHLMEYPVDQLC